MIYNGSSITTTIVFVVTFIHDGIVAVMRPAPHGHLQGWNGKGVMRPAVDGSYVAAPMERAAMRYLSKGRRDQAHTAQRQ